jgi:nickel/cobalt transporter (NiCoT) family protein
MSEPQPGRVAAMARIALYSFNDRAHDLRGKIIAIFALLIAANAAAWTWALVAFANHPVLLGTCFLAYSLGLRHAVDADHIAAIDNVTRKLMQDGSRPVTAGLFFSLGHSTVVVLATIGVAATASAFQTELQDLHAVSSVIGTSVSAVFLLIIAGMNVVILADVYRAFQRAKTGAAGPGENLDAALSGGGLLVRIFRRLFRLIERSWHMYPLGFLFGLGFDTATEIALLGIAGAEASNGLSFWSILIFPALFTAGMTLIDTADSVLMVGAYGWAFIKPVRKLYYNMTITFASVVVAVLIGGFEALSLIANKFGLSGGLWDLVATANDSFGMLGYLIVGVFALTCASSMIVYRLKGYDQIDVETSAAPEGLVPAQSHPSAA